MVEHQKNVERFSGFVDSYEEVKPSFPEDIIALVCTDLGRKPAVVVDLGSGLGASTRAWAGHSGLVVGIEPNADRRKAAENLTVDNVAYHAALAHDTGLQTGCADVVCCSQSFHWMEPHTTLQEINRLLAHEGVFLTIDNEWPPTGEWRSERLYKKLVNKVNQLELAEPSLHEKQRRWAKENHLINMSRSGYFRHTRQVFLSKMEIGDADRFIKLALSQRRIQAILACRPELILADLMAFEEAVKAAFNGQPRTFYFSYRVNIGIK